MGRGVAAKDIGTSGFTTDQFPTEFRAPTVYPRKIPGAIDSGATQTPRGRSAAMS